MEATGAALGIDEHSAADSAAQNAYSAPPENIKHDNANAHSTAIYHATAESKEIRKMAYRNNVLSIIVVVLIAAVLVQAVMLNSLSNSLKKSNLLISSIEATLQKDSSLSSSASASNTPSYSYNINGTLFVPPTYMPNYPSITQQQPFGKRLTNINQPLNSSELSVINNASDAYFEIAGNMFLNGSLNNYVGAPNVSVNPFILNGKPSVIYLGSITCIFCGENRWAMALALGRFGRFSSLYEGYSSFGDGNLPTLYWRPVSYTNSTVNIGNFYNSSYINFLSIEDTSPITGGFELQPLSVIQNEVNATADLPYIDAINYIIELNQFAGTPYTIWGNYQVGGADAVDFGNTTPSSAPFPITNMTHAQVLAQLANPKDQFAWTEYAGADIYIALTCGSINNTAQICSLPAIQGIEKKIGV